MNLLWTFFLVLIVPFIDCDESLVLDLSSHVSDSFKSELSKHGTSLVMFFAPWCGHCKSLKPHFEYAAEKLTQEEPIVQLAKVDCTSDTGKKLCDEFGVSGYPTLKIFKNGELSQEYNGPRERDGIVKYMRAQTGPASKAYNSFKQLEDKIKETKEVLVIGLFNSESDDLANKFMKVADKLRESVNFAHVYTSSASDDLSALASLSSKSFKAPTVILHRPLILSNKFEDNFVVHDSSSDIEEFIRENYHGLVGHRTQNNLDDFKQPYVIVYYEVDYVKNPKGTNYWRNRVLKVVKDKKGAKFSISDVRSFAGELDEFGLEDDKSNNPLVAARDSEGKKYVLKEKFSVSTFETFVNDFLAGKLEPYLKSEDIPADNSGPVKVAVGKNIDELVLKSSKDVFIEFYAPWCGHCKKLAPTWEELGKALKDESNIDIVKMDATANDVPSSFSVHGFPTLYFYPSDTKEPKKYEGERELQSLINYVAKHSTKELVGYTRDGQKKKEEL